MLKSRLKIWGVWLLQRLPSDLRNPLKGEPHLLNHGDMCWCPHDVFPHRRANVEIETKI